MTLMKRQQKILLQNRSRQKEVLKLLKNGLWEVRLGFMACLALVMTPVQRVLVVKNILTLYGTLSFLKAELFMVIG